MFSIAQKDHFTYPVKVEIVADGGKRHSYGFDATFRRLSREEFLTVTKRAQAAELDDAELIRDVLLGWKGIEDEKGEPLPYSEEAREALLDVWPVLPALVNAFIEAHSPTGRTKN